MRAIGRATAPSARSLRLLASVPSRSFSDAVSAPLLPETHLDIKYNGRQSVSGVTATVFGAYGFVGRYVVNRLGRIGSQCIIPYRGDGMSTRHLKVMGDLGQIVFHPMDLTDVESIKQSVKKSNVVINLIGANHETKNYSYDDVHVKVTHRIAKICAEAGGVKRFIHVSAAGADPESESAFLKTKGLGEQVVKDFFPQATIIRPCQIFGDEDKFLNTLGDAVNFFPIVPMLGDGEQKLQPIYVQDVAQCIVNAMVNSDAPGKTYTLGGPEVLTQSQVIDFVSDAVCRDESAGLGLPDAGIRAFAKALTFLPKSWRIVNPDDVNQLYCNTTVPKGALGCEDLGLKPVTLEKEGTTVLIRHRGQRDPKHGAFEYAKGYGKIEAF